MSASIPSELVTDDMASHAPTKHDNAFGQESASSTEMEIVEAARILLTLSRHQDREADNLEGAGRPNTNTGSPSTLGRASIDTSPSTLRNSRTESPVPAVEDGLPSVDCSSSKTEGKPLDAGTGTESDSAEEAETKSCSSTKNDTMTDSGIVPRLTLDEQRRRAIASQIESLKIKSPARSDDATQLDPKDGEKKNTSTDDSTTNHLTPQSPDSATDPTASLLEDETLALASDIALHNRRILDFTTLRASPSYTPTQLPAFTRDWLQTFCEQQRSSGGPKHFTCAAHLLSNTATATPCASAQEYGAYSLSRAGISHFFGHNKLHWTQVPLRYRVVLCRKHYQTGVYRGWRNGVAGSGVAGGEDSYQMAQVRLLRAQIGALEKWRPGGGYAVRPTVGLQRRIDAFHKSCAQGKGEDQVVEDADGMIEMKRIEGKVPIRWAVDMCAAFRKEDVDAEWLLAAVSSMEEGIKDFEIAQLLPLEFLLHVRDEDRARVVEGRLRAKKAEEEMLTVPEELRPKKRGGAAGTGGPGVKDAKRQKLDCKK